MKNTSAFPSLLLSTICALGLMTCVVSAQFPLTIPTRATTFPLSRPHQSGKVIAWGNNDIGQTNVPTNLTNAVSVAAGNDFCLALKDDGTVIGWGSNTHGQATPPTNLTDVVAIAAGAQHGVALKADGSVVCWGDNSVGQTDVPLGLTNAVAISTKWLHSLALLSDGTVVGWGTNGEGEATPPTDLSNVVAISAGWVHSMALRNDGTVAVWGSNYWEQSNAPQNLSNVVAIADCGTTSFALLADGIVVGWGRNSEWPVVPPPPITRGTSIVTGYAHVYATLADGTFQRWGFDGDGVLNLPSNLNSDDILALGGRHNLAIRILPPSGDEDGDGVTNFREEKDGTNPDDPSSFKQLSIGLVADYPLKGNPNNQASDIYNLDQNENAYPTYGRFGQSNSAYFFTGYTYNYEGHFGLKTSQAFPFLDNITVTAWFCMDPSNTSNNVRIVEHEFGQGSWVIHADPAGMKLYAVAIPFDYDFTNGVRLSTDLGALGNWIHVSFTYDTITHVARLYVNGQLKDEKTGISPLRSGNPPLYVGGNAEKFHGAISDVCVYNRALSSNEIQQLFSEQAFTEGQRGFVTNNPSSFGHYSQAEYNANRTSGQTDVTANPSAFDLFTQQEFANNRTAGQSDVINNPMSYGLYTSSSIMDLRMGGLMIQKQGNNAVISFQPQTTTDLTQPFTNNGTPITNEIPMPGNKGFIRINAKP
jgi:hypothetical protein